MEERKSCITLIKTRYEQNNSYVCIVYFKFSETKELLFPPLKSKNSYYMKHETSIVVRKYMNELYIRKYYCVRQKVQNNVSVDEFCMEMNSCKYNAFHYQLSSQLRRIVFGIIRSTVTNEQNFLIYFWELFNYLEEGNNFISRILVAFTIYFRNF